MKEIISTAGIVISILAAVTMFALLLYGVVHNHLKDRKARKENLILFSVKTQLQAYIKNIGEDFPSASFALDNLLKFYSGQKPIAPDQLKKVMNEKFTSLKHWNN